MSKKILMICGYRTTGKDSLFEKFIGKNDHKWFVYKKHSVPVLSKIITQKEKITRYAFADELKKEVGIITQDKDTIKYNNLSARDIYINYAKEKRSQDINYFCRKVYLKMIEDIDTNIFVITDFRYYNEHEYICGRYNKCFTIRVFRQDVVIPPEDVESEHQLDNFLTDYLLTTIPLEDCKLYINKNILLNTYTLSEEI